MRFRIHLAVMVTLLPLALARAESPTEGRLRDALRTAQGQVRALEDERAAARAEVEKLQAEAATLKVQLAGAKQAFASAAAGGPRAGVLKAKLDEQTALVATQREALTRCEATAQQLDATAKAAEELRTRLADLDQLKGRVAACDARNAKLYRVGRDVIDWLYRLGFSDALGAREPFLGLKRVELENAAQDFEDKLLEHRSTP